MSVMGRIAAFLLLGLVAACAQPGGPAPFAPGPPPAVDGGQASQLLEAFRHACKRLPSWTDGSGLTRPHDWAEPCRAAEATAPEEVRSFLVRHFRPVRLAAGQGLVTGYFVPEYPAQPSAGAGLVPALAPPAGLDCAHIPCPTRAEIMAGALDGRAKPIAWLDPVDLAFLQVQGSGLLRLPDGRLLKLGYAASNGRPYVAIGRTLKDRGVLATGAGMREIRDWLRRHADARDEVLASNPRYVFFRVLGERSPFPVGTLGSQLVGQATVAVDPALVPMGAIVELQTRLGDGRPFRALLVAADSGSAILGPNRFDIFFGTGEEAAGLAGRQQAPGRATIWIPRSAP